jgi:hypothetical protein
MEVTEKFKATSDWVAQIVDADFTTSLATALERAFSE